MRNHAIGVNFIDVYFRTGLYKIPSMPATIGMEGAGIVRAVGAEVKDIAIGDRVAYATGPIGAYASDRVIAADRIVKLPDGIDDQTAAAMMLQGMTAQYLIRRTHRVQPGETIVDLCAGGGGKTLALASQTRNGARLIATDGDPRRLAPIHERLRRSGALAEVRTPRSGKARADVLEDLDGKVDRVLVDAPCTGSGTWRRNPDAKWRLRPGSLALRIAEQSQVLDRAAKLVRPGGRIVYVTCSLLPAENDEAVAGLLSRWRGRFDVVTAETVLAAGPASLAAAVRPTAHGLQMTPLRTGTDGFYVAVVTRRG